MSTTVQPKSCECAFPTPGESLHECDKCGGLLGGERKRYALLHKHLGRHSSLLEALDAQCLDLLDQYRDLAGSIADLHEFGLPARETARQLTTAEKAREVGRPAWYVRRHAARYFDGRQADRNGHWRFPPDVDNSPEGGPRA